MDFPMKEDTVILVSSPFQALNALEAISALNIDNPVFLILGNDVSAKMTGELVKKCGYSFECVSVLSSAFEIIKNCRKYGKHKRIIVGDYYSIPFFLMSMVMIVRGGHIVYVDDGNSTLSLLPPVSRKRLLFKNIIKQTFYNLLHIYKNSKHISRSYFTFYDVEGKGFPFPVIKNNFTIMKRNVNVSNKDIYIIGTNTYQLQIARSDYIAQLEMISKYVKTTYPGQHIFYCPHRRDLNQYDSDCETLGVSIYNTKVSVEVDFATNEISPMVVIGFGSTALLTLRCMFPKACIIDLVFHHNDEALVKEYRSIEREYKRKGINVVELNKLYENAEFEINQ